MVGLYLTIFRGFKPDLDESQQLLPSTLLSKSPQLLPSTSQHLLPFKFQQLPSKLPSKIPSRSQQLHLSRSQQPISKAQQKFRRQDMELL